MSLFENLSEHDKDLINHYIDHFAYTDADDRSDSTKASLDYLLRYWNTNKEYLYNLFGQKFIIERPVSLKVSVGEIADLLNKEYSRSSSPYYLFRQELRDLCIAGDTTMLKYSGHSYRSLIRDIVEDTTTLATNIYEGGRIDVPTPDGKTIVFERGCKPMRILGKLAKAYDMKTFEDFRIWHSQKLNQKALNGTLCLSIHPLDFMTMSDNECDWTSCMSWQEEGCYRSGTVECMNSPLVLVAYLKSENGDMHIPGGSWNNKKWRSLFIVHDKVITNVKGYPYRSDDLNTIVLNWLLELIPNSERYGQIVKYDYVGPGITLFGAPENTDPQYNLDFVTGGHMYNDFGCDTQMGLFVHDEIPAYSGKGYGYSGVLIIDYSGEAVCMHCGAVNDMPDDETELVCVDCSYEATCECCECHVSRDDYFIVDGRTLCYECYHEHTMLDPITDERHYEYDMSKLYLVPEDSKVDEFTGDYHWDDLAYISVEEYTLGVTDLSASYPAYFVREDEVRCVRKWWSKWYYVRPSDLTPAGLKLFKSSIEDDHGYSDYEAYYQDAAEIIREGSK